MSNLTAALSDAEMEDAARRNPNIADEYGRTATRAYHAATALPFAPRAMLDRDWNAFRHRMHASPKSDGRPNSAADILARVAQLRIGLEATEHFTRFATMSQDERQATFAADQAASLRAAWERQQPQAQPQPPFSPSEFTAGLTARGIIVGMVKDAIAVRPASKLTDRDRVMLREHRDAIKAQIAAETEHF